jgi:hypothetical protein
MSKKTRKAACIFVSLLMLNLTFVSSTFCQQLTIREYKNRKCPQKGEGTHCKHGLL